MDPAVTDINFSKNMPTQHGFLEGLKVPRQ